MTEKYKYNEQQQQWYGAHGYKPSQPQVPHGDESASAPEVSASYEESPSSPSMVHKYTDESSPAVQPSITYGHSHAMAAQPPVMKKTKKKHYQGYMSMKHHVQKAKHHMCPPILCDPQYVMHDCFIPREVPVIQPIIHVYRHNIVNVPKHYVQPSSKNVVVDPGCPR